MRRRHRLGQPPANAPPGARFVGGVVGFVFGGIGLTVLAFLWSAPFDEFGSPPLFFRIFGSFIAAAFVAMGGGAAYAAIRGTSGAAATSPSEYPVPSSSSAPPASAGGYKCPNCGAPLGPGADVSPSGDAKCSFCKSWFNVHRQGGA